MNFTAREYALIIRALRAWYDRYDDATENEMAEFKAMLKKLETLHWEQYKKEGE